MSIPETGTWLLLTRKGTLAMGRGCRGCPRAAGASPEAFPAPSEEIGAGGCEVRAERLKWLFLEFHGREEGLGACCGVNEGTGSNTWRNKAWEEAATPKEGTAGPGRGNQRCGLRLDAWKNPQLPGQCPRWGEAVLEHPDTLGWVNTPCLGPGTGLVTPALLLWPLWAHPGLG